MARRYKDWQLMEVADDFKFEEEVYELVENFNERDDKPSNYIIQLSAEKDCTNGKERDDLLGDTKICRSCYYRKLLDKLSSIRKSKREEFIRYQMNLRKKPELFLAEIEELIIDNESYFKKREYGMKSDYISAITKLKIPKKTLGTITSWGQLENYSIDVNNESQDQNMELDIFISHSSKDAKIAEQLIELIRSAFSIESKKIRCTSVDGYKLKGGVNTDQKLNEEIKNNRLFIGLLSAESISSTYVLFEMGARWGLQLPIKLIVFDSSLFSKLSPPLRNMHIINISSNAEIHQLLDEIEEELDYERDSASSYVGKISDLENEIKVASK